MLSKENKIVYKKTAHLLYYKTIKFTTNIVMQKVAIK